MAGKGPSPTAVTNINPKTISGTERKKLSIVLTTLYTYEEEVFCAARKLIGSAMMMARMVPRKAICSVINVSRSAEGKTSHAGGSHFSPIKVIIFDNSNNLDKSICVPFTLAYMAAMMIKV